MGLQRHTAPGRNFVTHHRGLLQPSGFEDEATCRRRKVIANKTSSSSQGLVDHFLIGRDVTGQGLGNEYMGIDCTEVEVIREDHSLKRSHVHVQGVRIRSTDSNHAPTLGQKIVPALQCFKDRTMPDELREERVKGAMQFGWHHCLKFAQTVPKFDARVTVDIPGFPGNVRLVKGGSLRVTRMSDKR